MRGPSWMVICFLLLSLATGCGKEDSARPPHVARTSGGAIALSYDERIAVVTNRSANSVTVLSLKPERGLESMVAKATLIPLADGSEPWAAIVGADDDTAYVLLRQAQKVVRIDHLRHDPTLAEVSVSVGSEPTALALSPTGKYLFVANWVDGTLMLIHTESFLLGKTFHLNEDLVGFGVLGEDLAPRAGLAHPRALTISDDGDQDDGDETLYAAEFFGQPMPERDKTLSEVDRNHVGLIYTLRIDGKAGTPIPLSPIKQTGFVDSRGQMTSCFANQLSALAVDHGTLYVTATCTSPQGPLGSEGAANFKTVIHPAVFAVDEASKEEAPERARLLTAMLDGPNGLYAQDGDSQDIRMPLTLTDLAFRSHGDGSSSAYVLAQGADAVFRLEYDAQGSLTTIGSPHHRYVGGLPEHGYAVGLAVSQSSDPPFALALSDVKQELSIIDVAGDQVLTKVGTTTGDANAAAIKSSAANIGKGLFATGLGVWSFEGQAWSSCESCHPDGGSDGVTWYFARGPRRTLSPANTYEKLGANVNAEPRKRLMLWGSNIDEVHDIEVIVRTVSGGTGAVIWQYPARGTSENQCRIVYDGKQLTGGGTGLCNAAKSSSILHNGLNGALSEIVTGKGGCKKNEVTCDSAFSEDWNQIDAFIREVRRPRPPSEHDATRVEAGRQVFEKAGCGNCHAGPLFTASMLFYKPSRAENGAVPAPINAVPPTTVDDDALGHLRRALYNVPLSLAGLNPAAKPQAGCAPGSVCSTFRVGMPPDTDAATFFFGPDVDTAAKRAGNDQLLCSLRDVGTFPVQAAAPAPPVTAGKAAAGVPAPEEYRQDGTTLAQGDKGFGIPSLLGLQTGGPYFHAGNARTLEEALDGGFAAHFTSGQTPPSALPDREARRNLIEFLLSLSELSEPIELPAEYDFCR